jgi:hypothetical protein
MTDPTDARFEGHPGRECGEHRTLGGRAWCHSCSEYCYPDGPCRGCELPQLRDRLARLLGATRTVCAALDDAGRLHATTGGPELAALITREDER